MIDSKKPMVGHHMIYDLTYLYSQFIDDLPDTFIKFAEAIHSNFPIIYDSRSLAVNINSSTTEKTELKYLYGKV